jgi:hypothetical protein
MAPIHLASGEGRKKKTVMMGCTILAEMELPLHLRGEGVFFGGHQKKGRAIGKLETAGDEKMSHLPPT